MSSPAETFVEFQQKVQDDAALHSANAETFVKLFHFAEDPASTNVGVRGKMIAYIAQHIGHYDASVCKKAAQLAVKILSTPDTVDALLVGAIKIFVSLASISAEKRPDYFAREGADVLIQVCLADAPETGFSVAVRHAANDGLEQLSKRSLKSVLTKLIHLISDDREIDEADEVQRERTYAIDMLARLAAGATPRKQQAVAGATEAALQWTEEVQQHLLTCLTVVLHTVPRTEFVKLLDIAASLPLVKEKEFTPLLEAFLTSAKLDSIRDFEGLALIGARLPRTASYPQLAEKLVAANFLPSMDLRGAEVTALLSAQLKVLVLASRLSNTASAEPMLMGVMAAAMMANVFGGEPENLTVVEGLLLSLCFLGAKASQPLLTALSDATLSAKLSESVVALELLEKAVVFAVKKKQLDSSNAAPSELDALSLTVLHNILHLLRALSQRHLPALAQLTPSWEKTLPLPHVKRLRGATESHEQPKKKNASETAKQGQQRGTTSASNKKPSAAKRPIGRQL